MISKVLVRHLPEWIEASVIVGLLIISAVAIVSISYYRLQVIETKLSKLDEVPAAVERVNETVDRLELTMDRIEGRLHDVEMGKRTASSY